MHDADRALEKYELAKHKVTEIAAAVRERRISEPEGTDSPFLKFGGRITRALATTVYNTPRRLHATAACNRCRTCERICPARNIAVTEGSVHFGSSCTQCYACIHWCPQEAVEIGGRTAGKRRYHHPDVTIRDMLDQRGEV
jgi:Fe-S-cluster-containing hydrogenase component 2